MIVKQGREMGIEIPMAGGDGWDSAKLPEIAGKAALNNTYFSSLYSPDDDSALNKAFVSEYEKAYKVKPDVFAALAYDLCFAGCRGNQKCRRYRSGENRSVYGQDQRFPGRIRYRNL